MSKDISADTAMERLLENDPEDKLYSIGEVSKICNV